MFRVAPHSKENFALSDKKPSLLENESRGGDTAESGFTFQTGIIMSQLPRWLADEGFAEIMREAVGDTEIAFFRPGGIKRELLEAKNHHLTPVPFWKEIDRFRQIDLGSPGTYTWFTLVSTGLSDDLKPLINGLRRVRDPHEFYDKNSAIRENSYNAYVEVVEKLEKTPQEASFLFTQVLIDPEWSAAQNNAEALFIAALCKWFPHCNNLSARETASAYKDIFALISKRKAQPISRKELLACIPKAEDKCVTIKTLKEPSIGHDSAIRFDWHEFFDQTNYPEPSRWQAEVIGQLQSTRDWILRSRDTRRIFLKGSRRLSSSLAFGYIFSAVAGFSIDLEYRAGDIWASDSHATGNTPSYIWRSSLTPGQGNELIVSIGVIREVADTVRAATKSLKLEGLSHLDIFGKEPLTSEQQLNAAVRQIKDKISQGLKETGAARIHLFFAGPAPLALFLGHRLNATAPVTCYEFVPPNSYVKTCSLG